MFTGTQDQIKETFYVNGIIATFLGTMSRTYLFRNGIMLLNPTFEEVQDGLVTISKTAPEVISEEA